MDRTTKIYIAGHTGLVGASVLRRLQRDGFSNIVTRTSKELNLLDQSATRAFFAQECPEVVVLAAARVGGIMANMQYPAQFIYDNILISSNIIEAAHQYGTRKLLNLGSSCIYPRMAAQPIEENALLTGPLEPTNRPYAIAKIAAIEMCDAFRAQYGCDFISAMPTNLYGPYDNFSLNSSHVLPALMRRTHEAKLSGDDSVTIWGTGTPRRELMYSDDLADACMFLLDNFSGSGPINVGTGTDVTIRELAEMVRDVVGFEGELLFDTSKPDGTPRKLMDVSRLNSTGWKASTPLHEGMKKTYQWFLEHQEELPERVH